MDNPQVCGIKKENGHNCINTAEFIVTTDTFSPFDDPDPIFPVQSCSIHLAKAMAMQTFIVKKPDKEKPDIEKQFNNLTI
jgi:hypothetical protein